MTTEPPIAHLINVMAALRHPVTGCAWDHAQDFSTIAPYTVEEAYEVQAAIATGDAAQLKDELGDLLFQVVYLARLAQERGWFGFDDVAAASAAKMIHRHPHVFGDAAARDAAAQTEAWEAQKAAERGSAGTLAGIATALPALVRAQKLNGRAARVNFEWPDAAAILDKLAEETAELRAELPQADPARLADEVGDMLFVMANLARKLGLNAETCLAAANAKFTRRFEYMEAALAEGGQTPMEATLPMMERLWQDAKRAGL